VRGEVKPAMNGMRKLVSASLRAQAAAGPHPDAEALSAFAEQALPDIERKAVLQHISECANCRDVVFLSLPDSAVAQPVLALPSRRFTRFALGWGTLAAAIAVCAVVFVGTRHHETIANYKVAEPAKEPGRMAAELKTPSDVAEMRTLRDDRVATRTGAVRELERDKMVPTPKHMTAKPAGKFDFDQNEEVRLAPGSNADHAYSIEAPSRSFTVANSRVAGTPSSAPAASAAPAAPSPSVGGPGVGGLVQNQNAIGGAVGQGLGAGVSQAKGNLNGTVSDPSGAVIPNATVTMVGPAGTRAQQADRQGQFAFDQLSGGSYSVTATAPGFQTKDLRQVAVLDGKASNVQVTLNPASSSETVEVSASSQVVNEPAANDQFTQLQVPANQAAVASKAKQKDELKKTSVPSGYASFAKTLSVNPQWTLSPSGALLRSLDSGKSWQAVSVGKGTFRALSAVGAHVWVAGSKGILYHSVDFGQSWTKVTPLVGGQTLQSDVTRVDFADALNGTLTTADGEVLATSDSGQTWNKH
jgi:Carboxypeptidase regulatory-like domain/Photosynthesis system II assembly factor YCF48/Putative zinc-finger